MIFLLTIVTFFTQLIFIGTRTWNVQSVSEGNIPEAIFSGFFVNLSWLASTAIGIDGTVRVINLQYDYLPVVIGNIAGGLVGTYIAMIIKKRSNNGKTG